MSSMPGPVAPWEAWNVATFLRMHATAASPHGLVMLAIVLATLPLYAAFALAGWRIFRGRERRTAVCVALAVALALGIEALVSTVAFHPRPFAAGFGPAWIHHAANNSMPSTHVTLALTMALVIGFRRHTGTSLALLAMGTLMAWARVYVGVHWPADMIGAAISACLSSALAYALSRRFVAASPAPNSTL